MFAGERTSGTARACAALALACLLAVAPAVTFAIPPTTTATDPSSGMGLPYGPGVYGWWVVPPLVTLTSNQDGVLHWHWGSDPDNLVSVTAGNGVVIDPPAEGTRSLTVYTVNGASESEAPWVRPYATDSEAPSQPDPFGATLNPGVGIDLVWGSSTDPAGGSGMLRYNLYRKTGLPPFTPADILPVLLLPGATSHTDVPPGSRDDYIYAISGVDGAGNESPLSEIDPTPTLLPVHRFFNFQKGTHFFTASAAEKAQIESTLGWTFRYEGVAYPAYGTPTGVVPLHRFYNFRNGTHFYTASESEKQQIQATLGWTYAYEGVAYWVSLDPAGTTPVHRFFNFRNNTHFYTASASEKAQIESTLGWTYRYEGVAFYVLP